MRHRNRSFRFGGFTLVELLVVTVILAIAASIVLMNDDSDQEVARSAARVVMKDLEYAKSEAIRRQEKINVKFVSTTDKYQLRDNSNVNLTNSLTGTDYVVDLGQAVNAGGRIELSANFGSSNAIVTFNANGEPLQGTTDVPVSSTAKVTVSCGDDTFYVNVAPISGRITVTAN